MRYYSVYKVPQGKLLKISLTYDEHMCTIRQVRITGDFFAYPEEAIELLEQELDHTVFEHDHLIKKIQSIINKNTIQFIGVDAEGLTQALLKCKQ